MGGATGAGGGKNVCAFFFCCSALCVFQSGEGTAVILRVKYINLNGGFARRVPPTLNQLKRTDVLSILTCLAIEL